MTVYAIYEAGLYDNDLADWRGTIGEALDLARAFASVGLESEIMRFDNDDLAWDHTIYVDIDGKAWSDDPSARAEMGCIQ